SLDTILANSKNGRLKDLGEVYHDISLVSSSLLTDSKFGGLKKDLNIMFSQEKLPEDFRGDTSDIGLRPYTSEDGSPTEQNRPIGSWNQLYLWANVWDSSTKREGQDTSAALQWDGRSPSTLIAADAAANMEMMDNRYTYMRHPILLRFYSFVGIQYVKREAQHGARGGHIDVRVSVIPVYVWWNPYNVDMKFQGAEGGPWGSFFGEHRYMPLMQTNNYGRMQGNLIENWDPSTATYSESPFSPYSPNDGYNNRQIADFGASFRKTSQLTSGGVGKAGEPSTLKAGEIVIFAHPVVERIEHGNMVTQSKANKNDVRVDNFAFKEGWDQSPGQVSSYAINQADGIQYQYLSGSGYEDRGTAMMSIKFAETLDDLNYTPNSVVLCTKYTDEFSSSSNKLGSIVMVSGIMDPKQIGKAGNLTANTGADMNVFSKAMPSILNLNWGAWEKPLLDQVKLPADMFLDNEGPDDNLKRRGKYGSAAQDSTFVAYYG
ncbi:hypothetical protein HHJ05_12490, partial [Akkermansia muciniphila]|nr:hypothetical protein [Akkermansia muciniphila]MBT8777020.1 hypothetical protein [Akkermansia muciniphila]